MLVGRPLVVLKRVILRIVEVPSIWDSMDPIVQHVLESPQHNVQSHLVLSRKAGRHLQVPKISTVNKAIYFRVDVHNRLDGHFEIVFSGLF